MVHRKRVSARLQSNGDTEGAEEFEGVQLHSRDRDAMRCRNKRPNDFPHHKQCNLLIFCFNNRFNNRFITFVKEKEVAKIVNETDRSGLLPTTVRKQAANHY